MVAVEDKQKLVTLDDIRAARSLVREKLHHTPFVSSSGLSQMVDMDLRFKAELFQKTGSFKPRGIMYKISQLTDEEKQRGVITISAGNAAQAVAYAATQLGIKSTVIMPEHAVESKANATRAYGARLILHGTMKDLMPKMREIQDAEGQILVHPFDDPLIIAGHGTLGLELLEDGPTPDVVIVPIGGGGLISGIASAIKLTNPKVRIIGVEPEGAQALTVALAAGHPVPMEKLDTIADGLAAPFAGDYTLPHVQAFVDEVVLVNDAEIAQAMRLIMERCKILPEPAAAASFAALLYEKTPIPKQSKVICVLSGGNVDMALFKKIF